MAKKLILLMNDSKKEELLAHIFQRELEKQGHQVEKKQLSATCLVGMTKEAIAEITVIGCRQEPDEAFGKSPIEFAQAFDEAMDQANHSKDAVKRINVIGNRVGFVDDKNICLAQEIANHLFVQDQQYHVDVVAFHGQYNSKKTESMTIVGTNDGVKVYESTYGEFNMNKLRKAMQDAFYKKNFLEIKNQLTHNEKKQLEEATREYTGNLGVITNSQAMLLKTKAPLTELASRANCHFSPQYSQELEITIKYKFNFLSTRSQGHEPTDKKGVLKKITISKEEFSTITEQKLPALVSLLEKIKQNNLIPANQQKVIELINQRIDQLTAEKKVKYILPPNSEIKAKKLELLIQLRHEISQPGADCEKIINRYKEMPELTKGKVSHKTADMLDNCIKILSGQSDVRPVNNILQVQ